MGEVTKKKRLKQSRILLKQVEDLKTRGHILGRKVKDHISGAPAKAAQFRVIRAWIRTAQALFRQANKRQERFFDASHNNFFSKNKLERINRRGLRSPLCLFPI